MMLLLMLLGSLQDVKAAEISIIDVRRNITLAEEDPVYKDFYIAATPDSGLKKNLVVTAVRKINVRDAAGANSFGEILVPVGQLKIIAIYDKVAVAREFNLLSRDELPMLEQTGIMNGDRIDLRGSFIDNSKPKKRKPASESAAPSASVTTTTVTTTTTTTSASITPAAVAPAPVPATPAAAMPAKVATVTPAPQAPAPTTAAVAPPKPALTPPSVAKEAKAPASEKAPVIAPPLSENENTENLLQSPETETTPKVTVAKLDPSTFKTEGAASVETPEILEKVTDSGNNSEHE